MNEKKLEWVDRILRPAGALAILCFSALAIFLNFSANDSSGTGREGLMQKLTNATVYVENWFYETRTAHLYKHKELSPRIVAAVIDDESLARIGRWPWSRKTVAKLIDRLRVLGAKTAALDIIFAEGESAEADGALAKAIGDFQKAGGAVILGYGRTDDPAEALKETPVEALTSSVSGNTGKDHALEGLNFFAKNDFVNAEVLKGEPSLGFIDMEPDRDGVFRHSRILAESDKTYFPNLGFATFMNYFAATAKGQVKAEPASPPDYKVSLTGTDGKTESILVNPRGEVKVRYYGDASNFLKIPAHEILGENDPERSPLKAKLEGKAVIVGSTALGAHDLRHTPVDPVLPGIFVHMNLFHMFEQRYFFKEENESMAATFALFAAGSLLLLYVFRRREPLLETGTAVLLCGAAFAGDYFYFAPQGFVLRLFFVLFAWIGSYTWFTVLNVFKEAQEKKKIKDTFQRYVAPDIVKDMLANPEKLRVGGEKKEITMLFSDVRDFTSISERLSPQELSTLLNIYMGKMTDILFDTHGTLDKYIGDALVGFWGAPLDLPDHAYQAVRGAKQMLDALPDINREFERRKFPKINVGIGLNTGEVSVGNMGSDRIFAYTALGDNMNLASRLESLTKYYGVNLMISEYTLEKLGAKRAEFKIRPLDAVKVKGKTKAVKIFEVLPNWNPLAKEDALLEKYSQAYEGYLARKFEQAKKTFEEILDNFPEDKASKKLKESCETCIASPPPEDWDGVTVMSSK